jgi:predicted dehydrogenase
VDAAAAAGCAIFCEKPLATDLPGAEHLVGAVAAAGVPAQSGLVLRSAPVFRDLRALVASGALGRPMAATIRDDQYFPIQGTYGSKWRADVAQAGGGCLLEHSIHDVDILRFCFGEAVGLSAHTANFSGHHGIEDRATVSLSFASGLEAHLTSVWHNILSRGSSRRLELFCEEGMVWLDDEFRGPLHVQTSAGIDVRPCPPPAWVDDLPLARDEVGLAVRTYTEADRAFVGALASGQAPAPSLADALMAHRLVDAAYRSAAAGGQPVTLA